MKVLLVIDMLNDFCKPNGKLYSKRVGNLINRVRNAIEIAREKKIPIIFCCDAHEDSDIEIKKWGKHAMKGTWGSKIVDELKPEKGDYIVYKRCYNAFGEGNYKTNLDKTLKKLKAKELILVGNLTDCCVLFTVFGAFYRNYKVNIIKECVDSISKKNHENGLYYLKFLFDVNLISLNDL